MLVRVGLDAPAVNFEIGCQIGSSKELRCEPIRLLRYRAMDGDEAAMVGVAQESGFCDVFLPVR